MAIQLAAYASIRTGFSCLLAVMTAALKYGTYEKWLVVTLHCYTQSSRLIS